MRHYRGVKIPLVHLGTLGEKSVMRLHRLVDRVVHRPADSPVGILLEAELAEEVTPEGPLVVERETLGYIYQRDG
jgi:hypothetical protein